MTADRLAAIRDRLAAATPGPWEVEAADAGHSRYEMNVWIVEESTGDLICDMDGLGRSNNEKYDDDGYADAWFIANAPADIAYLLDRLREVTAQRDAARAKLAEAWHEGIDAALEWRTQLTNPYLPPGEDGPRG